MRHFVRSIQAHMCPPCLSAQSRRLHPSWKKWNLRTRCTTMSGPTWGTLPRPKTLPSSFWNVVPNKTLTNRNQRNRTNSKHSSSNRWAVPRWSHLSVTGGPRFLSTASWVLLCDQMGRLSVPLCGPEMMETLGHFCPSERLGLTAAPIYPPYKIHLLRHDVGLASKDFIAPSVYWHLWWKWRQGL